MNSRVEFPRQLSRRWTVCLLHHSHTDVGYTDIQSRVIRRHVGFIDKALDIVQRQNSGDKGLRGFVWNSECFWSVEQWLRATPSVRHAELADAIRAGAIGLSGTYQHFTELVDDHTARRVLERAREYAKLINVPLDTAISADINGFSWGYSQALYDSGISNLVVCLHAHHGRPPLTQIQRPFYWLTPEGDRLLVWLGEHYMLGNMLGLAPGGVLTYSFNDEFLTKPAMLNHWSIAGIRLWRYLQRLEDEGYPIDFVPVHISGLATDNAPPSESIVRFINDWNAASGSGIHLEMTTASTLCARVRAAFPNIQVHAGDWPDWWSDGVGSVPVETRICRQAQREYRYRRAMAESYGVPVEPAEGRQIEEAIAHYCEHTFGHAFSVHAPWSIGVRALAAGKAAYASKALQLASASLDGAFHALGEGALSTDLPFIYRVINPLSVRIRDVAKLALNACEFGVCDTTATIAVTATGRELPFQKVVTPHGLDFEVRLDLAPGETLDLELREGPPTSSAYITTPAASESPFTDFPRLETEYVRIDIDRDRGVTTWQDKCSGRTLLRADTTLAPFTPISEYTPVTTAVATTTMLENPQIVTRTRFGLNRKGDNVRRQTGRLTSIHPHECGVLRRGVQLCYQVESCSFFHVLLSAWMDLPRVDVTIQLHKESVWEPENLYVALPFAPGGDPNCELWIEKAGALVRPGRDQLPQTLLDYYCLQDGFALLGSGLGLAVATPDSPLLQLGPLAHGPRPLMGDSNVQSLSPSPYAWLMTNFWETNFEACLGGFHEFSYRLEWGPDIVRPSMAIELCRALNHGLKNFRLAGHTQTPAR